MWVSKDHRREGCHQSLITMADQSRTKAFEGLPSRSGSAREGPVLWRLSALEAMLPLRENAQAPKREKEKWLRKYLGLSLELQYSPEDKTVKTAAQSGKCDFQEKYGVELRASKP